MLSPRHLFSQCVHCDLSLGDMTEVQGHDTLLDHRKHLCERVSNSNFTIRSHDQDIDCNNDLEDTTSGQVHAT